MSKVAILGYGRFGRAFAEMILEAGFSLSAYDPHASIAPELRAPNLAELVRDAEYVVLAAPVSQMRMVLRDLVPHLRPEQLLLDVGSVKVVPMQAMQEALGERIPWIATHPLFGPVSLARAERPLRVVVCPNEQHPDALARAKAFYEKLSCEVMEQTADEHDKLMARTHALAFFVAKGILYADKDLADHPPPFVPPSFLGIARTMEAVRGDAGHLYRAIEQDNPYAGEVRQALIDALVHADREIRSAETWRPPQPSDAPDVFEPEPLTIPDLGRHSPELREARSHIDAVDREIVTLLSRRAELAARAGTVKRALGHGVLDPLREARLLAERREWAEKRGLSPAAVDDVFQAILRLSRSVQRKEG